MRTSGRDRRGAGSQRDPARPDRRRPDFFSRRRLRRWGPVRRRERRGQPIRTGSRRLAAAACATVTGERLTTGSWWRRRSGRSTAVTIIDSGRVVSSGITPTIGKLDFYRARLSVDGKSLLYNAAKDLRRTVARRPRSGARRWTDRRSSHDPAFRRWRTTSWSTPDGTVAAIAFEDRPDVDGMLASRGNKLVEVAPDNGTQRTVWTSWKPLRRFGASGRATTRSRAGRSRTRSITTPARDVYYLPGMRNFSSIARVNRATVRVRVGPGFCAWVDHPTLSSPAPPRSLHQHQLRRARQSHPSSWITTALPRRVNRACSSTSWI